MNDVVERLKLVVVADLSRMPGLKAIAQSPIVDIIIGLIPVLLPLILECFNKPKDAARKANSPDLLMRLQLRRKLKKEFPGRDDETEQFREYLFDAYLAAGKTLTEADFVSIAV